MNFLVCDILVAVALTVVQGPANLFSGRLRSRMVGKSLFPHFPLSYNLIYVERSKVPLYSQESNALNEINFKYYIFIEPRL